jgi:hypothetical protein
MGHSPGNEEAYAFVTVEQSTDLGFYGGCLLLNRFARPLEFHCSLPIQPSKAHVILYGDTLLDYVCGELIARGLVQRTKTVPALIFTDSQPVLSLRHVQDLPVAWVIASNTAEGSGATSEMPLGDRCIHVLTPYARDLEVFRRVWEKSAPQIDLQEPFGRIRQALSEANPLSKAA